ncbi:hypothetical protein GWK47_018661 [Chionoecetes opilio]|uniref:Uncharacterized protein n=1 Tax=Chionoecetes opilio TaxID=41210 RepID=A0A8J4XRF2_CHIOP|nr:hypothetical protein GWK47_018661 [Chionoecetes opilio]
MDGKGDLHSQDHPLPRGVCAHQAREEGADPVHDVYRHNVRGTVDVRPPARPRPRQRPRPPQALAAYCDKEIGRASGKVMARHMWYVSEELVGLSLFDERTVVEEKRAIVSTMQQRLGEKNPPRRADVALDAVEQRSLASFATTNSVGLVTAPRGRSRFPQRRSGRVVGEGRLHHGSSARAVTYGW